MADRTAAVLEACQLAELIEVLRRRGHEVVGPAVRDGAIVYDSIASAADLPAGWTDEQQPAYYRLRKRADALIFGYGVGPQSWKKYLHPDAVSLWTAERQNGTFRILNNETPPHRYALLGVRSCELEAIRRQDSVFLSNGHRDSIYQKRREGVFIVAVQCTQAAATCFCASMGTGPRASTGFDLALTELAEAGPHRFLIETGSRSGREVLAELKTAPATEEDFAAAREVTGRAASQQVRGIETEGLADLLERNFEHPEWDSVAERCLSCGNCTMVCPTCFCTTVEDVSDVAGKHAERRRYWDSCFTLSFSYIHGGSVRASSKARYRQWLTHKFSSWRRQFGTSGCVGCGRCITWCPVGIDITEEVAAIRRTPSHGNS